MKPSTVEASHDGARASKRAAASRARAFVVAIALGVARARRGVARRLQGAARVRRDLPPRRRSSHRRGDADRSGGPNAPFFVLLVGNDYRPGVGGARGDALHLVGVNPKLHKATMLDIPRDTCWNGDKINAANAQGGAPAQAAAVGGLVGVPRELRGRRQLRRVHRARRRRRRPQHERADRDARLATRARTSSPGVQHMTGDAALRVLTRPPRLPAERHHPHRQPGPADPRRDRAAAERRRRRPRGQFHLITLLYQHAQLDEPRRHRPVPARPRRCTDIPVEPDPQRDDPDRRAAAASRSRATRPGLFADFRDDAVLESTLSDCGSSRALAEAQRLERSRGARP